MNWCHAGTHPAPVSGIGEASHPGPDNSNRFIFETFSVTTLNDPINRDVLLQRKAHAIFIQEQLHATRQSPNDASLFHQAHCVALSLTDLGQCKTVRRGWLDCCTGDHVHEPSSRNGQAGVFQAAGTCRYLQSGHGLIDSPDGHQPVWVARSRHHNRKSRNKTDELITAAQQEFDTTGIGPKIILCDFNTDVDSSPAMRKITNDQGWTDVASVPAPINTQQNQSTCKAHGVRAATRRDFILANDLAVPAITSCITDTQAAFDVHSSTAVQMSPKDFSPTVFTLKKPKSFEWQRLKTRCIQRVNMEGQDSNERLADEQEIKIL